MSFFVNRVDSWNNFSSSSFSTFLVVIVFLVIVLFSAIIGYFRGLIGGIYSLLISIVSLIVALIVSPLFSNLVVKKISSKLNIDVDIVKPAITGLIMFIVILSLVSISNVFYLFVKPFSKRIVKRRKKEGKKLFLYRGTGALTSAIASFPLAVVTTNLIGIASYNNEAINFNNKLMKITSLNTAKGFSKYLPGFFGAAKLSLNTSEANFYRDIFKELSNDENYDLKIQTNNDGYQYDVNLNLSESKIFEPESYKSFLNFQKNLSLFSETKESFDILAIIINAYEFISFDNPEIYNKLSQIKAEIFAQTGQIIDILDINFSINNVNKNNSNQKLIFNSFSESQINSLNKLTAQKVGLEYTNKKPLKSATDKEKLSYIFSKLFVQLFE
ncbi:CvpA family protein [Mycoplasmopsis lipofaciens]|uniref:CvpA family protein n=1 Tax=Mycoplasmopsis lipofaciens TaxID=114884 RepID=UPI0004844A68|nr:CvpA family protein [Mycoplasmopsis lipofaciens]